MLGRLFQHGFAFSAGERARWVHEAWLTRAMESGLPLARIPVRPVADGGFSTLLANPAGRDWANAWWLLTLERTELDA